MNKKTKQQLLNMVKQNYEDIADDFSNTRNYIWPELKKIITVKNNDEVLDLGCGNGRLTELFLNKNINYTGIEQSHKLIKIAQAKYPQTKFTPHLYKKYSNSPAKNKNKGAGFIQGDILKLEKIIKQKFNLILFVAVLQHIPTNELRLKLLKQIKNILEPNGKIIISNWDLHKNKKYKKLILKNNIKKLFGFNSMDFNDIIFKGFNKDSQRYYHAFTKKELNKLLNKAGFNIEKLYSDNHNIYAICTN